MVQSKTTSRIASRNMLKAFGIAGAASAVIIAPNSLILFEKIIKYKDKRNASKTLSYLKYHKLVESKEKNGKLYFRLTKKGRDKFERILIDELIIQTPKRWDHKWRMVIFDIPVNKNRARRNFLHHLRTLNFYKLQDSVWVHPFECTKQVGALLSYLDLENHVSLAVVEKGNFTNHVTEVYKKAGFLM